MRWNIVRVNRLAVQLLGEGQQQLCQIARGLKTIRARPVIPLLEPLQLQLQGPDATTLTLLADSLARLVRQAPGAVDVGLSSKGQKPEIKITVDRGLAGSLGVSVGQIAQALRPAFAGVDAGTWVDPSGETRYIRVRLPPEFRESPADLARFVFNAVGEPWPPCRESLARSDG